MGEDAAKDLMRDIAAAGGGKSYNVKSPRAIPRIFQHEAMRVARPLIYESEAGMTLQRESAHEMLKGIGPLPPITGYVLTNRKDSPLAEVALLAPRPADAENRTILAGWTYGLGRAVAFTSDAGARWTKAWPGQAVYDKIFGQMVRWSMRPAGESGRFITTLRPARGRCTSSSCALDKNDDFLNFLAMNRNGRSSRLEEADRRRDRAIRAGPLRGEFCRPRGGKLFCHDRRGAVAAPIRTGIDVPYSDEFRDRDPNDFLLRQLAETVPKGGLPGKLIEESSEADPLDALTAVEHVPPRLAGRLQHGRDLALDAIAGGLRLPGRRLHSAGPR